MARRLIALFNIFTYSAMRSITLTVCSCHVTYPFQDESTLYNCMNVKELLARSRRKIWSLSGCKWTRTQNHLVLKWTLNQFGQMMAWVRVQLQSLKLEIHACFEQGVPWQSGNYRLWIHSETDAWHDKNICTEQISTQNTTQSFGQFSQRLSLRLKTKWSWVRAHLESLRSVTLIATSSSFQSTKFRTNRMTPEVTCCSKQYKRSWCKY